MTTTARRCRSPGCGRARRRHAVRTQGRAAAALIGHLNLTHPNIIQVIGAYEGGHARARSTRRSRLLPSAHPARGLVLRRRRDRRRRL